ncbi:MAG: hypothetical protein JWN95_1732 [Frankiales bacterium]|nr:hypothetical protein [Frankiales bacterium]
MPRLVIQGIAPHLDDTKHQTLEDAVRDLRYDWDRRPHGGYAFPLLSALDESRLTDLGRRRLGEYRRAFGVEQPIESGGILDVSPHSPISSDAASRMADDNWLQAIARHSADARDWSTRQGGARELSSVLKEQTTADPIRFAKLALRLTDQTNTAYTNAILWGMQGAPVPADQVDVVFDCVRHIASLRQADNDRWLGFALSDHLREVPLDVVELIRDRAVSALDPIDDRGIFSSDERSPGERLRNDGLNSARGALAETLGDILVFDTDGSKTTAVIPALPILAADPVVSVRGQAAHTIGAALRSARADAVAVFPTLIDTDDSVLTVPYVRQLMMYIGNGGEPALILPVIERMLVSENATVRTCGGQVAGHAAVEWELTGPLAAVMRDTDEASRKGVAQQGASSVTRTRNVQLATATLTELFDDPAVDVRKAAAEVAAQLRNEPLLPYSTMLAALIESAAYEAATPQLFITLQNAPDRVDSLVLRAAQRYIEVSGEAAGDMRTGAAGNAHYVADLAIRGLAQARRPQERSALLDVVDGLMRVGAYGVDKAVEEAAR